MAQVMALPDPDRLGYAGWTIRLPAEQVVERKIVEAAHFNTVGRALKKRRGIGRATIAEGVPTASAQSGQAAVRRARGLTCRR